MVWEEELDSCFTIRLALWSEGPAVEQGRQLVR
jgi:hypothetical protein